MRRSVRVLAVLAVGMALGFCFAWAEIGSEDQARLNPVGSKDDGCVWLALKHGEGEGPIEFPPPFRPGLRPLPMVPAMTPGSSTSDLGGATEVRGGTFSTRIEQTDRSLKSFIRRLG